MNTAHLLHDLTRAGVRVAIATNDPAALDVDGPATALTPARLDLLRRHKSELMTALRRRELRRHVADLLRQARRTRPDLAVSLRDAWAERVAICTVDGGLSVEDAEKVALVEITAHGVSPGA